jgi:hypothetical protein
MGGAVLLMSHPRTDRGSSCRCCCVAPLLAGRALLLLLLRCQSAPLFARLGPLPLPLLALLLLLALLALLILSCRLLASSSRESDGALALLLLCSSQPIRALVLLSSTYCMALGVLLWYPCTSRNTASELLDARDDDEDDDEDGSEKRASSGTTATVWEDVSTRGLVRDAARLPLGAGRPRPALPASEMPAVPSAPSSSASPRSCCEQRPAPAIGIRLPTPDRQPAFSAISVAPLLIPAHLLGIAIPLLGLLPLLALLACWLARKHEPVALLLHLPRRLRSIASKFM